MDKIKVLVVEDSLVFRGLLVKYINQDPDLQVVAVANDPFEARDAIIKYQPDVMTLDVELPKMDGIEFLRKLMPQYPLRVVVISTLSNRVFDALQAGALEFVAKPQTTDRSKLDEFVSKELPSKIKIAANSRLKRNYVPKREVPRSTGANSSNGTNSTNAVKDTVLTAFDAQKGRSEFKPTDDMIVAIGASTGGTEATSAILEEFGGDIPGVVVTQHMPEGFTRMYADRLNQRTDMKVSVKEAEQGDIIKPGHIYIAPGGDRHMEVIRKGNLYQINLKSSDKVNGHRPSVEVLFDSVAKAAGDKAVGVILTGMGGDGAKGLLNMRKAGARTIGQDESTCVVYGMPRVAYEMGAVEYQDKLGDITKRIYYLLDQIKKKNS